MADLECYSVHSVKGGVGKSTVATLIAIHRARETNERVFLIDMDLTGTSLGDVLPICAPRWTSLPEERSDFLGPPTDRWDRAETMRQIELRGEPDAGVGIPFLNDFLLFQTPDWAEGTDLAVEALCWKFADSLENLHVLCSSALPSDLEQTLPVIYDEEHSAFLQHRLEFLLADIARGGPAIVIFDTPPTIPGLS